MCTGLAPRGEHINNSNSTLQKLLDLYVGSELSDITLVVGSDLYHVHKLILSMSSDVLKTMLTDLKWPEAFKDRIVLNEEPECCGVFSDFIRYMYTGNIHLTNPSVLPILTLADKYNIRDLSETCISFMCENCDATPDAIFVVSWLQYSRLCSYKALERHCLQYIKWNFQKVLDSSDFLSMSIDTLTGFLQSSSLVVIDEYSLFVGIKRWLLHQRSNWFVSRSYFERLLQRVMIHVRFSKFKQTQLEQLMLDPFTSNFSHMLPDTIRSDTAVPHFHLQDHHKPSPIDYHPHVKPTKFSDCMPRNYLCEDWSTQLVVENFTGFEKHACRTLFFSTPSTSNSAPSSSSSTLSNSDSNLSSSIITEDREDQTWDWQVDLYPRGIFFPRAVLIGLHENYLIDQQEHSTVRIGVIAKCFHSNRHVEITVLAIARGQEESSEYVKNIVRKKCIFDSDGCLYNVDNIVQFSELDDSNSLYLTGPDRDTFKIIIIIKPSTDRTDWRD